MWECVWPSSAKMLEKSGFYIPIKIRLFYWLRNGVTTWIEIVLFENFFFVWLNEFFLFSVHEREKLVDERFYKKHAKLPVRKISSMVMTQDQLHFLIWKDLRDSNIFYCAQKKPFLFSLELRWIFCVFWNSYYVR